MSNRAWVTLATNDSYGLGALVLAHSLRRAGSLYPAVVLITPSVTEAMRERLRAVFADVVIVDVLDSKDAAHLALLQRPELGITFTKIHCWNLTQYEKCVFLDADTLVVQNCDELFEREELSAAPDVGWPDCFNSGVFVFTPSADTFSRLVTFAQERGSFDGGDQGLLNSFFSDWARGDINKHLPFLYNVTSAAFYSYLPALKHYGQDLKIIHFIGAAKPWLQHFNFESRSVDAPEHIRGLLQLWWDLFVSQVHTQLDTSMDEVEPPPGTPPPELPPQDVSQHHHYQPVLDPESEFPWHRPDAQINREPPEGRVDMADIHDPWDIYQGQIPPKPDEQQQPASSIKDNLEEMRQYAWEYQQQVQQQQQAEQERLKQQEYWSQSNVHTNEHNQHVHQHYHSEQQRDHSHIHSDSHWSHEPQHDNSHDQQSSYHDQSIYHHQPWHHDHSHSDNFASHQQNEGKHEQEQYYHSQTHEHSSQPQEYHSHQYSYENYNRDSQDSVPIANEPYKSYESYEHTHHSTEHSHIPHTQKQQEIEVRHVHVQPDRKKNRRPLKLRIDYANEMNGQLNGDISDTDSEFFEELIPPHPYDGFYLRHRVTIDPHGRKICSHEIPPTPSPSPTPPDSPTPQDYASAEENNSSDIEDQSGVAGNLARVVPGVSSHEALDDLTRRQGWEAGNIDYMGADSFDKIWAKISQTLSQPRSSPPKEASPPPAQAPRPETAPAEGAPAAAPVEAAQPEAVAPLQEPAPVESAPAPEPAPVQEPVSVKDAAPVQETTPVSEPAPVQEPAPVPEQAPVATPVVEPTVPEPVLTEKVDVPAPVATEPAPSAAPAAEPAPPAVTAAETPAAEVTKTVSTEQTPEGPAQTVPEVAAEAPKVEEKPQAAPAVAEVPAEAPPPALVPPAEGPAPASAPAVSTPEKPAEVPTDSPPLANTPSKEEAPAAKSTEEAAQETRL